MIALALTALLAFATLLAIAAIAQSWRQYGAAVLALRSDLKQCETMRSFSYRIISNDATKPRAARIFALPVRVSPLRQPMQSALRAAA
jgi:hypothetical protein